MAVHKFARYLTDGWPVPLYEGGRLERDYTYVSDAVDGTVRALDHVLSTDGCFEVLNLADSRTATLTELLRLLEAAFGIRALVRYEERPPGDVARTWGDIAKARSLLGFEPRVDLEEGVRRFTAWYRAEGRELGRDPGGAAAPAPLRATVS
jgi:UDP-glucuronate 4-epimerase